MSTKDIINETSLSFRIGGVKASNRNHKTELTLLDGYEFRDENGNVINATRIVLEKKKQGNQAEIDEHCKGGLEYLDYIKYEKGK